MKGTYRIGEVVERFTVDGDRYVGFRDDGDRVELDGDRVVALHDGWQVRGGRVGPEVLWRRGEEEHRAQAAGFTGSSPAYDVQVARALGLQVGESRRLRLVEISEPVGAARTVEQSWARVEAQEADLERYDVTDLQTGERWVVHLSGGVLVSREGARGAYLDGLVSDF